MDNAFPVGPPIRSRTDGFVSSAQGAPPAAQHAIEWADLLARDFLAIGQGTESPRLVSADYDWLTETGNFIVSNNGIEWAVTYFLLLLALFFIGGGRYVSADYWIARAVRSGHGNA